MSDRAEMRADALLALRKLAPPHVTRDYRPEDAAADAVRRYIRELEEALTESPDGALTSTTAPLAPPNSASDSKPGGTPQQDTTT